MKTTEANLQAVVDRINRTLGTPMSPYTEGKSTIGNYHLNHAYGGVSLFQMDNESGGVRDVLQCGHVSKPQLYQLMHAFLRGIDAHKKTTNAVSA